MSQNQSLVDVLSQDPGIRTALRRPRRRQPSVAFLHTSSQDAQDEGGLWAYLQSEDLAASAASAAKVGWRLHPELFRAFGVDVHCSAGSEEAPCPRVGPRGWLGCFIAVASGPL